MQLKGGPIFRCN